MQGSTHYLISRVVRVSLSYFLRHVEFLSTFDSLSYPDQITV